MSEKKTSRTYAQQLQRIAAFLESKPEFELDFTHGHLLSFYTKDNFVAAVKAIGSSTKKYGEGEYANLEITPVAFPELKLSIQRSSVCRKVVKFECEPLFSEEEVEAL